MFRFVHSSDLHIGRRYANMPEDLRGRLREARHGAIGRLAEQARANGASTLLLAGDTFDTETPTPTILRQAIAEMAQHSSLQWVLLPGNHDSLLADELWNAIRGVAPQNVVLATEPQPMSIAPGVALLPAPCTTRRPGRDLTEWMNGVVTPEGTIRIGLAHGAVQDFSEDGGVSNVIAPDRAINAGLDYLALGDWHGPVTINARTRYSGTPEPDRFKHNKPGEALVITIAESGATPEVAPVETGSFKWQTLELHLLTGEDTAASLLAALPAGAVRRQTLLQIAASGRVRLGGRAALRSAAEDAAPDFAHLELNETALVTDCESDDLDRIDRAGALREAAEALLKESSDEARSSADRDISREALVRLFTYSEALSS
ncbi:MAG: DNA repair exonuclease [Devosia sp.]|nr:DNA repair exonuclease [Devosia sp.]